MESFSFDLGGFLGAVLGAIAAAGGVVYSLRRTSQYDREKERSRISSLRRAIIVETKLSFSNAYYLEVALRFTPDDPAIPPFEWWRQITPQIHVDKPAVVEANLDSIGEFEESEIEKILLTLSAMKEFADALSDARSCVSEGEFARTFTTLVIKRGQLLYHLNDFFSNLAPKEEIGGKSILNSIRNVSQSQLPAYWTRVGSGPGVSLPSGVPAGRVVNPR